MKIFLFSGEAQTMIKTRRLATVSSAIGVVLILSGILVSSPRLIQFIRSAETIPMDLQEQLLLGATLFRIGLVILGLVVIVLGSLSIWEQETKEEISRLERPQKSYWAILAVILLVALVLRLYKLDSGLWYDEIVMNANYMHLSIGEIITTYDFQNQHFLYTLLARAALSLFGESVWALRLPAVLFGVGSIGALYLLGRQVVGVREALLSAALLTVAYHHIWFSQNARGYIGLLFWTIMASWLFLAALRQTQPRIWLLYALAAALGVYTHMTMLFVILGHFIIHLIMLYTHRGAIWPKRWAGFLLGFGLAGLLTLQLYALVLPQVLRNILGEESEGGAVEAWTNPLWTLFEFIRGLEIGFTGSIVAIAALAIFGAGFLTLLRKNSVIVQLLVIPTFIAAVVTLGLGHHLWPRIFFFAFGFAVIVVVHGVMLLSHTLIQFLHFDSRKAVPVGVILCSGLILISALSVPFVYGPKQDYEAAREFVEAQRRPGDAIVTVGLASVPYRLHYNVNWEEAETLKELNTIRSQAQRTWVIYTLSFQLYSLHPDIVDTIQRDFVIADEFHGTLGDGTIFVYKSDIPPL